MARRDLSGGSRSSAAGEVRRKGWGRDVLSKEEAWVRQVKNRITQDDASMY